MHQIPLAYIEDFCWESVEPGPFGLESNSLPTGLSLPLNYIKLFFLFFTKRNAFSYITFKFSKTFECLNYLRLWKISSIYLYSNKCHSLKNCAVCLLQRPLFTNTETFFFTERKIPLHKKHFVTNGTKKVSFLSKL